MTLTHRDSSRSTFTLFVGGLCALMLTSSCGAAPVRHDGANEPPMELGEARSLEVITAKLRALDVRASSDWEVDIGGEAPMRVDVRLGAGNFGIEFVTRQDRVDNLALPAPSRSRELQILPGANDDARAQVLLLDEHAYGFDPHLEHVQAGAMSAQDAEGRLERDVADYVEYVRGQGGP